MSDTDTEADTDTEVPDGAPIYMYKPSISGAPWTFRLGTTALEWNSGYRAGRVAYDKITEIRMLFRPGSLQMRRYLTEIRSVGSPKLALASTSYTGIVSQATQDGEYSAFLSELHRRIAAAGGRPALKAGSPFLLYWPGVLIVGAAAAGFVFVLAQAFTEGTLGSALLFLGFGVVFLWQGWQFFWRNRPRSYSLDEPPDDLLPKARG